MSGVTSRIQELRIPAAAAKLAFWIRPADDADELPLLHRLVIIYLMLPVVIWLVGWFEWWLGIPAALLLAAALWQAVSGSLRAYPRPATLAILAVAACWVMVTAAGGLFDGLQRGDWPFHRLTLVDLGHRPWPTYLTEPITAAYAADGDYSPPILRYNLAYYMTPALAAQWFGVAAMNWALPIWTWLGIALILLMFTRERRGKSIALAVLVFIFFGGMDAVRVTLLEGWDWLAPRIDWEGLPGILLGSHHIEQGGTDQRLLSLSNMTIFLQSPQHFIAPGLYTFLMLQLRGRRRFLAVVGVLLAAAPFWSPFVAVGLLPLLGALLWKNGVDPFLRWPNLLLAAPLVGLIALYLTSDSPNFEHGWIWELDTMSPLWTQVLLFYLLEFLLLGILVWILRPDLDRNPFFVACMVTLILLPLYYYGNYNDLFLRGSVPSLLLLCWYCVDTLLQRVSMRTNALREGVHRLGIACIVVILGIGSLTAFVELARATNEDHAFRFGQANIGSLVNMSVAEQIRRERIAYDIPAALRTLLRDVVLPPPREKGELVARSEFDIYLHGNRLAFVKQPCAPADVEPRFFLHVIPSDENDLPEHRRQNGFDNLDFRFGGHSLLQSGLCVAIRYLPNYDIAKIATGQFTDKGRTWTAEILELPRPEFDVYLDGNRLAFVKQPCTPANAESLFFVHVYPADIENLPKNRRQYTFDHFDFRFEGHGIQDGQLCAAVRYLPNYDIARIVAGQYTEGGSIWTREILVVPRSEFDVYLNENRLAFVKEPCSLADTELPFFVHVYPFDDANLSENRRQHGFDILDFRFEGHGIQDGQLCAAVHHLPNYDIAKIVTGQFIGEHAIWTTEIPPRRTEFDPEFDVYLDENKLTFVKQPCTPADAEPRFFLHVHPVDDANLSENRRQHGFNNLDFNFEDHGMLDGQLCTVVRYLPNYDIAKIATGQLAGEHAIWKTEISPRGE